MVTVAKSAGFCFGVSRAVDMVFAAVKEGKRVRTFGPIIWYSSFWSWGYMPSMSRRRRCRGIPLSSAPTV